MKITAVSNQVNSCRVQSLAPFEKADESIGGYTSIKSLKRIKYHLYSNGSMYMEGTKKYIINKNNEERYVKGESKHKQPSSNVARDLLHGGIGASSYTQTKRQNCSPRPDNSTLQKLYCLCKTKEAMNKSRSLSNQGSSGKNHFRQESRLQGRTYIHVFLPSAKKQQAGKIEDYKHIGGKEETANKGYRFHFKHRKTNEKVQSRCELELPLVTFAPPIHSRTNCYTAFKYPYNRTIQSKKIESISLADKNSHNVKPKLLV